MTFFLLASQGTAVICQIVIAAGFGATGEMDAFIAASTLPQYVIAVFVSALTLVFIPLVVGAIAEGREADAWHMASSMINASAAALIVIAVAGIVFAESLLRLTIPGLPEPTLLLASRLASIIWPSIVATGLISLLGGLHQVVGRFTWSAVVPFIGALANLTMLPFAISSFGIDGAAGALVCSLFLQAALLLPILMQTGRYTASLGWQQSALREVPKLLYPMIILGLFERLTPVLDRYFASSLPEGNIAHLSYAFRIVTVLSLFLSSGFVPVFFPEVARKASLADMTGLRKTLSSSLIYMWILVAPTMLIGFVVAGPLVTAIFVRGQFTGTDAAAVAVLLQIYLFSLVGTSTGNLTGRCFYALKDTRTPAIVGTVQSLIYAFYAAQLTKYMGAAGLVWAYVIFFNVSVLWQIFILRRRLAGVEGGRMVVSMVKTGVAATVASGAAWLILGTVTSVWLQTFLGLGTGVTVYMAVLAVLNPNEVKTIVNMTAQTFGNGLQRLTCGRFAKNLLSSVASTD